MKNILLAISIASVFLVACGSNSTTETTPANDSVPAVQDTACCDKADSTVTEAPEQDTVKH